MFRSIVLQTVAQNSHSNLSSVRRADPNTGQSNGAPQEQMTPEEKDTCMKKLRVNCSWFQIIRVMCFYVSNCCAVPWRIVFDENTQTYRVHSPLWQKLVYIILELASLGVTKYQIFNGFDVLRNSKGGALAYFDMGTIIAIHVFELSNKVLWWTRREKLQEFLDEVQSSPLLKVAAPKANWRIAFLVGMYFFYLICFYFLYCINWGMVHWNWEDFYGVMQTSGESVFGFKKAWENETYYPALLGFNCFCNLHFHAINHFDDLMAVSWGIFMFNIAYDLREGMKSGKFTDNEILEMIDAHKRVTPKFNRTFGLVLTMYSMYCSPFYAIHLIDMFSSPGFMSRYNNALYLLYLGCFLCALSKITIMAKKRKRWLEKNSRYLKMSRQQLALFLDDMEWERFGVGEFVFISTALTADIVSQICTMSMLLVNMK